MLTRIVQRLFFAEPLAGGKVFKYIPRFRGAAVVPK